MPATSYHTLGGRIRGESSLGTRTDYLADALGSVTATVDQTGALANAYRHKPYGAPLARSGVGADPRFRWAGETGSRATGLPGAEQHNRARHYGSAHATWTSVDPLWPDESAYGYVGGSPTTYIDPSGLEFLIQAFGPKIIFPNPQADVCGEATFQVKWVMTGRENGMIVQRVCRRADKTNCALKPLTTLTPHHCFYEAWQVANGKVRVLTRSGGLQGEGIDSFTTADEGVNTIGGASIEGDVRFIAMPSPPDFRMDPKWHYFDPRYPDAGQLPTRDDPPPGWNRGISRRHFLGVRWNCCPQCNSYDQKPFYDPTTVIASYDPHGNG